MMKRRPTNRENSIIIGTILASGIVFVFGFFLGRAWVTIPQEQVDAYQKSSGTPVVLTEEKSETPALPKKKMLKESVVSEKPQMTEVKPKKVEKSSAKDVVRKPAATQPKQQAAVKTPVAPQKQQMIVQKPAVPQVAQKPVATQPKQQTAVKTLTPPQKQQMTVQKPAEKKLVVPQVAQKPAAAQPKQQTAVKTLTPPQKQQMTVQKPAEKKLVVPQVAQKPVAAQPKQQVAAKTPTPPQKQQVAAQKPAEKKIAVPQPVVEKPLVTQPKQQVAEKIEKVEKAEKVEKTEVTQKKTEGRFVIQLGSFSDEAKASALVSNLSAKGCSAYSSKMEMGDKGTWYRVYLSGIFKSKEDAKQKGDGLKSQGVVGNYFIITSR